MSGGRDSHRLGFTRPRLGRVGLTLALALTVGMALADQPQVEGQAAGASYAGVLPEGALWRAREAASG